MTNKPIDAGPAWDALVELDLNRHREDLVENTRRAAERKAWSATHREDPEYPDARVREESATATLAELALPLVDLAEYGRRFRRGRGGRG